MCKYIIYVLNLYQEIKNEMNEVEKLLNLAEKELYNLVNFMSETFPNQDHLCDGSFSKERLEHFEQLKNNIVTLMSKKAEKMNSIRRNSFAYIR